MSRYITKNFQIHEFLCGCGCGFDGVNKDFIDRLQIARDISGIAYEINSGCRCVTHNFKEGGKPSSDHLTGEGADIKTTSNYIRFKVLDGLIRAGFKRIGIAKTFIHVGSADRNPPEVVWLY